MRTSKVSLLLMTPQLSREDKLVCGLREHTALVCSIVRQKYATAGPNETGHPTLNNKYVWLAELLASKWAPSLVTGHRQGHKNHRAH